MNPRNTLLLAGVVAALGAFVWLYEIRGQEARDEAAEAEKRLFPELEADALTALELSTADGTVARLERREGVWSLAAPVEFPADAAAADGIASSLAGLVGETSFDEPAPLAEYGLDGEPRVRFEAGDASGALRLGKATPVGSNTYAATAADTPVHVVATYRVSAFEKSLDDLREKRILDFDERQLREMTLAWPDAEVRLARDSETEPWRVTHPVADTADDPTVDRLVSDLRYLRATGFDDDPADDETLGLAAPAFSAELVLASEAGEPRRIALAIGSAADEDRRAVRAEREGMVYQIAAAGLDDFPRRVDAYRDRELLRFTAGDAERVELMFQDGGQSHAVTAERGEDGWTSAPDSLGDERIVALVGALANLRAEGIAAESAGPDELAGLGLAPPRVSVRVLGAPGEEGAPVLAELALGVSDADRGVIAKRADREIVYLADFALGEEVPLGLEALRNRFVEPPEGEPEAGAPAADPDGAEPAALAPPPEPADD